jgi:3-oxoacyl-[acyl-carrier-protein] synthase III
MGYFSIADLRLTGIAGAVPSQQVNNEDLDLLSETESKSFVRTIGIRTRRVSPPAFCASDLCVAAAQRILQLRGLDAAELGALVFVTQTPDYLLPGNSTLVQRRLGLSPSTFLLDVNQGCAGYVYGLASLACLMSAARIPKGLLLVGDTITRLLSPRDRSTVPIFSDAGSATLLELGPYPDRMHFNLGATGEGAEVICVRGGGAREPFGPDSLSLIEQERGVARAPVHLAMRGMDVLHYVLTYVAPNIRELLCSAYASIDTPDYYIFHQANRILNECLVKKLGCMPEKAPETLLEYGNTSCATIPVTICRHLGCELQSTKRKLLLSGFGAGFCWGSALLTTDSILCPDLVELDPPAN